MNCKLIKTSLLLCCVFFISNSIAANASNKEKTSVLNRVQRIEDPELGELIRIALENIPELKELASYRPGSIQYREFESSIEKIKLQTVRKVTEAYTDIKLLDSQVEQINKRISSTNPPEALVHELILAKAELEAKLRNKLAELRESMHIIPIHPLGRRPVEQLNNWLKLDVIGDQVIVFNCSKPFYEHVFSMKHNFVKLMPYNEAFEYVESNINKLPIRIDISRNIDGIKLSGVLHKEVIDLIKSKHLEMEAEVHLDDGIRTKAGTSTLYLLDKKIGTYPNISKQVNMIQKVGGIIEPNEIDNHVRDMLIYRPGLLPKTINLEHDEQSRDLALSVEKTIKDIAKKAGVDKLVTVKMELYKPEEN